MFLKLSTLALLGLSYALPQEGFHHQGQVLNHHQSIQKSNQSFKLSYGNSHFLGNNVLQSAVGFNNSNQQGFANFQRSRVGLEQCKGDLEYLIQNNKKLERIVSLTMAKTQNIVNKKQSSHTNELYNKLQNNLYQEILSKYVSITEVEVMKHKYEEKIFTLEKQVKELFNLKLSAIDKETGELKRLSHEKHHKCVSESDVEIMKSTYEEKITILEKEVRELFKAKALSALESKTEQPKISVTVPSVSVNSNTNCSCLQAKIEEVHHILKTEPADNKFKMKLAIRLDKKATECLDEPSKKEYIRNQLRLFTRSKSWKEAKDTCDSGGMYLPFVGSAEDEQVMLEMMKEKRSNLDGQEIWLGLERQGSTHVFLTLSGEPLTKLTSYNRWFGNNPDNWRGTESVVTLVPGGMNDLDPNTNQLGYICKFYAPP